MSDIISILLQSLAIPLGIILYVWVFWAGYVLIMGIYRAKLANRLTPVTLVLSAPFVILGFCIDVIANLVIAPIVFLDLPKELLVTTRLQRYIKENTDWRHSIAAYVCDNLLDVFDPTGNHC